MPSVGPQLPPGLQKRRRDDGEEENDDSSSDPSTGPFPPANDPSPPSAKRARVLGPTLPPAPLDERPPSPAQPAQKDDDSSSDDGDDFGPALPAGGDASTKSSSSIRPQIPGPTVASAAQAKRDEWMTLAPSNGDWSARVDPTKLKNRKFNTGRGAKGPPTSGSREGDASWHETPEEKQARLKREVMGIKDGTGSGRTKTIAENDHHDEATARRLKQYNDTQRGTSLYATHTSAQSTNLDDDPSARAFDREKDIGGGSTITATQRRDMVKKAADFSSRFGKAGYL